MTQYRIKLINVVNNEAIGYYQSDDEDVVPVAEALLFDDETQADTTVALANEQWDLEEDEKFVKEAVASIGAVQMVEASHPGDEDEDEDEDDEPVTLDGVPSHDDVIG